MSGKLVINVVTLGLICLTVAKDIEFKIQEDLFPRKPFHWKSRSNNSLQSLRLRNRQKQHGGIYKRKWKMDGDLERSSEEYQRSERFLVSDWILMMKGVSGATGPDLFQLWRSNATLNTHLPLANHLTSEFNGHYKPDYSNHWSDYCIDQVKVSIYNHGVEKAYILFDARGSDKMSWFTDTKILRSSWADLKIAKKELVSMAGNAQTGQEFSIVGHTAPSSSCDSFGWFMVSTKTTCFFEMGDSKPTFYYAPGTSQAHWGFGSPSTTTIPPPTAATSYCSFRGHNYHQGETWNDGCSQKCMCSHAGSGTYTCSDLCLTWHGSPQCHLLPAPPGLCCEQVFCPSGNITIPVAFKDQYPQTANSKYSYV